MTIIELQDENETSISDEGKSVMENKERIDLIWASIKIPAFEKLMRQAQETKASEREYREKYGVSPPSTPQ